jgi:hypothetical protein
VITSEQAEAAIDYLRDSAKEAAVARSQARTLEKFLTVTEARQKSLHREGRSNAESQDMARASEEYRIALEGWQEAVRRDAEFTMLREAAIARLEYYRTQESTRRAEAKAFP